MKAKCISIFLLGIISFIAVGCGSSSSDNNNKDVYDPVTDPADFTTVIDNPYLTLTPGTTFTYEGETEDGEEVITLTVTEETREVMGVTCVVVRDTVLVDGELAEDTYDWFAQDSEGNVWYFGEHSEEYEDGEFVGTEGSWEAGVDGAKPGIVMYADPESHIGEEYRQEYYEGEAEDMGNVAEAGLTVTVGDVTYTNCIRTEEWTPLEPDVLEYKYYAPGVGLVLEVNAENDERIELDEISTGDDEGDSETYDPAINPADFTTVIDNPYLTLTPGATFTYEGETEDGEEVITLTVTEETREVMGVTCVVVRDTVLADGELAEDTYDWFAQDSEGNVWYFGEHSEEYENGEFVGTEGSWEAGIDGAKPGIIMKANPQVGDSYRQEYYAGEAEDMAEVVSLGETVTVGDITYTDCLKTREWTPLEPDVLEYKYYAPGVGLVLEEDAESGTQIELNSVESD